MDTPDQTHQSISLADSYEVNASGCCVIVKFAHEGGRKPDLHQIVNTLLDSCTLVRDSDPLNRTFAAKE